METNGLEISSPSGAHLLLCAGGCGWVGHSHAESQGVLLLTLSGQAEWRSLHVVVLPHFSAGRLESQLRSHVKMICRTAAECPGIFVTPGLVYLG